MLRYWINDPGPRLGRRTRLYVADNRLTGWSVHHCGHPTVHFPYLVVSPSGQMYLASNGRAFATIQLARAAAELLYMGSDQIRPDYGGYYRCTIDHDDLKLYRPGKLRCAATERRVP